MREIKDEFASRFVVFCSTELLAVDGAILQDARWRDN